MPASRSSCSRWLRTLEDTPPHRVCSSRNVAAGSFRSSQRIRSVQRRPSRSSTAMTARPLVDPRKGRPGSGARFADLSRVPGPGRSWLTRSAPAAARRWLSASTSEARLPGHDLVRSRTMGSELMETSYDVIIVGAGSAGATVAARLTQDPRVRVLLLEAGGRDRKPAIHIPAAFPKLFRTTVDWNYDTEPQPGLGDRRVYWPRGKTLGGSSSINAMVWVRGFAADYDHWAAVAGSGWGWESALECFRRIETTEDAAGDHQGRSGPMSVSQLRDPNPLTDAFLQACTEVGLGRTAPSEINGPSPEGVAQAPVTQRRGRRCSTADAYLELARRCRGRPVRGSDQYTALLMCSGIGPADHLRSLAISVLADVPEVGRNLADHLVLPIVVGVDSSQTLYDAETRRQLLRYLVRRRGMLTSNIAEAFGFVRSNTSLELPDIELLFVPGPFVDEGLGKPEAPGITIAAILLQPHSTGSITLRSSDPTQAPRIDPRYLSDEAGHDRAAAVAALQLCERILQAPALEGHVTGPMQPPGLTGSPRIAAVIERHAQTLYHPTSTCRMGSDPDSVVYPDLRVRGVDQLRVADASIMPRIIRGHTNAPAILIGERAADLISNRASQRASSESR